MTETAASQSFAEQWVAAFNDDVEHLARDLYAPDAVLNGTVMGTEKFLKFERRVLAAAPRRRAEVVAAHAAGDVLTVEAVLRDPDRGEDWRLPFCAVLHVADGKVVRDTTYADFTRWPGMS
jgi:ketosteroid isomerase-like protein